MTWKHKGKALEQQQIYARLTTIMRDVFDDDAITATPQMTAADVRDWDSVNHVTLIVAVEEAFGIKFQTSEVEKMKNVGQMVEAIEKKSAKR